ncbi:hypothetical protein ACWEPR_00340 [Streptomyces sp. NPDC004290]
MGDGLARLSVIAPAPVESRQKDWAEVEHTIGWALPADYKELVRRVMVNEARGGRWEHFAVSCTRFLADILDGELRSDILSSSFPLTTHDVRRL